MQAARKSGVTTLKLGFVDLQVALYKTTGDSKTTRWESRMVDAATGLPPEDDEPAKQTTQPIESHEWVPVQGDPLGGDGNEAAAEALDDVEDAERAWEPPEPGPEPGLILERQRGFKTEAGFVAAEKQLTAIEAWAKLDEAKIVDFIRVEQVDRGAIRGAYYLAPAPGAGPLPLKGLQMLYAALRRTKRAAVIKWSKKGPQTLGVIAPSVFRARTEPMSSPLVVYEMAWESERRRPPAAADLLGGEPIATEVEIDACCALIEAMSGRGRGSLDELEDDAVAERLKLRDLAERGAVHEYVLPDAGPEPLAPDRPLDERISASVAAAGEFVDA